MCSKQLCFPLGLIHSVVMAWSLLLYFVNDEFGAYFCLSIRLWDFVSFLTLGTKGQMEGTWELFSKTHSSCLFLSTALHCHPPFHWGPQAGQWPPPRGLPCPACHGPHTVSAACSVVLCPQHPEAPLFPSASSSRKHLLWASQGSIHTYLKDTEVQFQPISIKGISQ